MLSVPYRFWIERRLVGETKMFWIKLKLQLLIFSVSLWSMKTIQGLIMTHVECSPQPPVWASSCSWWTLKKEPRTLSPLPWETKAASPGKQRINPLEWGISLYRFAAKSVASTHYSMETRCQATGRHPQSPFFIIYLFCIKSESKREVTKIK